MNFDGRTRPSLGLEILPNRIAEPARPTWERGRDLGRMLDEFGKPINSQDRIVSMAEEVAKAFQFPHAPPIFGRQESRPDAGKFERHALQKALVVVARFFEVILERRPAADVR